MARTHVDPDPKTLYRVHEAADLLGHSRRKVYQEIRAKRIRVVKSGGTTRVPGAALRDYVELLQREAFEQRVLGGLEDAIERTVGEWPPLTDRQLERLATLLRPIRRGGIHDAA